IPYPRTCKAAVWFRLSTLLCGECSPALRCYRNQHCIKDAIFPRGGDEAAAGRSLTLLLFVRDGLHWLCILIRNGGWVFVGFFNKAPNGVRNGGLYATWCSV